MNNVINLTRKSFSHLHDAGTQFFSEFYHPKYWLIPFFAVLTGLAIWLSNSNQWLFLHINNNDFFNDAFWDTITNFGDPVVALTLLLPLCWKRPRLGSAVIFSSIIATFFVHSLKHILDVPRPAAVLNLDNINVIGPILTQHAFPSGHTATIFVMVAVLCLANTRLRYTCLLVGFASLVAISRISVGAHWPIDVVTGALIGWTSAIAGTYIANQGFFTRKNAALHKTFAVICLCCALTLLFVYDVSWILKLIALTCLLFSVPELRRMVNR